MASIEKSYYGSISAVYKENEVTKDHIKWLLSQGYPVIIPVAGQLLGNPNFRGADPPYHMLVIEFF